MAVTNSSRLISSNSVLKEFIKKALAIKYYYIAVIILFIIAAYFINKYSETVFEVQAKILLNNNQANIGSEEIFRTADRYTQNNNLENEINMLSSYTLVSSTINALNLEVGYFKEKSGFITQKEEVYDNAPFTVIFDKSHNQPVDVKLYIEVLTDSTFQLVADKEEVAFYNYVDNKITMLAPRLTINNTFRFNQTITTDYFKFSVILNNKDIKYLKNSKSKYYFQFYYFDYLTMYYLGSLKVEPLSPMASIIFVSFSGKNIKRINDFLNKYLELYLENSLVRRNKIAQTTIDFIDNQIADISDSLQNAESKLRDYRSSNQVVDMSFQGQRIFDQMTQIETQKSSMLSQKRYYTYIIDYLKKNDNSSLPVLPSSSNVVDPILNQLIMELITLNSERLEIMNDSKKNLFLAQIENKIEKQKETILENVTNNLNTLNNSISESDYRYNKLSEEISRLPKTELRLVGINRQYKLNDAIYTYLLQRKAESQISKASNFPDSEIIEPAREVATYIVYPKKKMNYLVALFLALFFPSAFILIRDFFNDKITSVYDIEHLTKLTTLGVIYRNRHKIDDVVKNRPNSYIAESFRSLRTNLLIKLKSDTTRSVLVTSSLPKEGKSFTAINLASSISLLGMRTIIVDCDLRRPTLHQKFNVENTIGLTNYLVNKAVIEDIAIQIAPNLDFIPAGPTLPNPSELLESPAFEKFFNIIRSQYDFIIIDTPPLGAIADSFFLMKYVNYTLLVTRYNYTNKEILLDVLGQMKENNVNHFRIVLNDFVFNKTGYSKYYANYYTEKVRKNKGKKVIRKT